MFAAGGTRVPESVHVARDLQQKDAARLRSGWWVPACPGWTASWRLQMASGTGEDGKSLRTSSKRFKWTLKAPSSSFQVMSRTRVT